MSKILALGTGPLLESGVRGFSAHCLRTWHFVKPLLDAGHEVRLYTLPISTGEPEKLNDPGVEERNYEGFRYRAFLNCDDGYNLRHLNEDCAAFAPDALLGVNSYPCAVISKISSSAPLWADLNGSVIIEAQAKAAIYGNNSMLGHYWDIEEAPLRRADRFSVVSMRQFYALHGELAAVGRLNRHTLAHSFAACIPNAFYPALADAVERERARGGKIGELADLPRNAFVLLWSGGYNSWTDVELLARALEQAMESCPDLHYVSTGGQIYGHDDLTYPRFEQLARQSKFCERFHLLGWVDADRIPAIWSRANLGLCVDSNNFETMFGARNRTVNMIASGVLVLTTLGAEISEELVKTNCALGCKLDDADDLARGIIKAYGRRDKLPELAARGRKHVLETYSYARTTEALLEWAKNPSRAPDNEFKINSAPAGQNPFLQATNPIEERLNRRAAHPYPPPAAKAGFIEPVKRALEGLIGNERYNKLRFLRREWMGHYLPRYAEGLAKPRGGSAAGLEELQIFLTNACNTRCGHCFMTEQLGQTQGELALTDYQKIAPTFPKIEHLKITGGEPVLHPQCQEIMREIARGAAPKKISLITNGLLTGRIESICASLLEENDISGTLEVVVSLDGLRGTHNAVRQHPRAWNFANETIIALLRLRDAYPEKFTVSALTVISDKNWGEIEELNGYLHKHYGIAHRFEWIYGSQFSLWGMPDEIRMNHHPPGDSLPPREKWDEILAALQRINRREGIPNHASHLASGFAVRMLQTEKRIVDCVSAGRDIGILYSSGDAALCGFSKPFGNLRDYGLDFLKAWTSPEADALRSKITRCHCTHPCYLAKNIEYSLVGQWAMLTRL